MLLLGVLAVALLLPPSHSTAQLGMPTEPQTFCTGQGGIGLTPSAPSPGSGDGFCTTQTGTKFCATEVAPPNFQSVTTVDVRAVNGELVLNVEAPLLEVNNISVAQDGACPNVREGTDGPPVVARGRCLQNGFRSAYCLLGGLQRVLINTKARPDKVFSREGLPGRIDCGAGSDVASIDLKDTAIDCESVTQGAVTESPNVRILGRSLAVARNGEAAVRLACPLGAPRGCRGRLTVEGVKGARHARLATTRYRTIRRGRRGSVRLRLSPRSRARARRFARLRVTAVERGEKGPKTTIATLRRR